jgi:hypothetical protein
MEEKLWETLCKQEWGKLKKRDIFSRENKVNWKVTFKNNYHKDRTRARRLARLHNPVACRHCGENTASLESSQRNVQYLQWFECVSCGERWGWDMQTGRSSSARLPRGLVNVLTHGVGAQETCSACYLHNPRLVHTTSIVKALAGRQSEGRGAGPATQAIGVVREAAAVATWPGSLVADCTSQRRELVPSEKGKAGDGKAKNTFPALATATHFCDN